MFISKSSLIDKLGRHLAAQGYYRKSKKGCFEKNVSQNHQIRLNLLFSGRVLIDVTPTFGVHLPQVEAFLKSSDLSFLFQKKYDSDMPTIFKQLDYFSDDIRDEEPFPIQIDRLCSEGISSLCERIDYYEKQISNDEALVFTISKKYDFPVGHHAYRIPAFLNMAGYRAESEKYRDYIESLNFITDYKLNIQKIM